MTAFKYVEFYDVPRLIAVRHRGKLLLLQSAFNHELDDYPTSYAVYLLPESVIDSLENGSWEFLASAAMTFLGQIPIDRVLFDPSKRKELDGSVLDDLVLSR
jgi:hypothetical protein